MLHNMILGTSLSGKTTLAKILCKRKRALGIKTAVLDPMRSDGWVADYNTHKVEDFVRWATSHYDTRCALFIDESGMTMDRYDKRHDWLATASRHLGHIAHFIAQYQTQLSPAIRGCCHTRWIFCVEHATAKSLAELYGRDEFLEASQLPAGEFFLMEPMKPLRRGKITLGKNPKVEIHELKLVA